MIKRIWNVVRWLVFMTRYPECMLFSEEQLRRMGYTYKEGRFDEAIPSWMVKREKDSEK